MNLIASVDKNWAIGNEGKLLAKVPDDMKWFKDHTLGRAVVMGHTTLETFPRGAALPERTNIVLTKDKNLMVDDCLVVHTLEELKRALDEFHSDDIFVVGGSSVYEVLLPCCRCAYITKFDKEFPADRYLPNLDNKQGWEQIYESEVKEYQGMRYKFCKYRNDNPIAL